MIIVLLSFFEIRKVNYENKIGVVLLVKLRKFGLVGLFFGRVKFYLIFFKKDRKLVL